MAVGASCICTAIESWQLGNEGKQDCSGPGEMTKKCSRGEITLVHRQTHREANTKV